MSIISNYANRRAQLAQYLQAKQLDGMIVTHLTHVFYLSGFTGSNAALWISADGEARISTDGRYTTRIAQEVPDIPCTLGRDGAFALLEQVTAGKRIGFEASYITVSALAALEDSFSGHTFVPVRGEIERLRAVKTDAELQALRNVAAVAHEAFNGMLESEVVRPGVSERDIAADLEYRMRKLGSLKPSFDTIVASGPNSALPHYDAGDRLLAVGDLVTIDFGAFMNGYNSDTTRTLAVGQPSEQLTEIYNVVLEAQLAGVEATEVGARLQDIDATCRDIISKAGYGEYFVHSTGHGVGLDVHEAPYAATTGQGELEVGNTLTIEPGIYIPGVGGVRIEDTLVVTASGTENLCPLPKQLLQVGV
ncbi:MAG: Xaa-Pro peptidase family protein [Corynebacterium sp.]|nr:Xaa-Pro peptidase family protein [Corynebacterium sp.]